MMDRCVNDLKNLLKKKKVFTESEFMPFFTGILSGLAHLRRNGILHCDLRLSNILVTKEGLPKIADFAKCRVIDREETEEE